MRIEEKVALGFVAGAIFGNFFTSVYHLRIYREDLGRLISVIEEKLRF